MWKSIGEEYVGVDTEYSTRGTEQAENEDATTTRFRGISGLAQMPQGKLHPLEIP